MEMVDASAWGNSRTGLFVKGSRGADSRDRATLRLDYEGEERGST